MSDQPQFKKAFPYKKDVLALPTKDLETSCLWYCEHFGMTEVERFDQPVATVILERDGTKLGLAVNGGDPEQDGAAILVSNIRALKDEFNGNGLDIGELRIDEQDGQKFKVFFVVAADGLCFYFHEPINKES